MDVCREEERSNRQNGNIPFCRPGPIAFVSRQLQKPVNAVIFLFLSSLICKKEEGKKKKRRRRKNEDKELRKKVVFAVNANLTEPQSNTTVLAK